MEIILPHPKIKGSKSLEECIFERESVRKYWSKEIGLEKVSQLLWAAQGIKDHKRTIPSAGAIYPLEIYVILKEKGLFYFNVKKHKLELKISGEFCVKIGEASWNQNFMCGAPLIIIICVNFSKIKRRYGTRGERYALIEVGHCAQNIHLEAVALGLGSVPIGAFEDKKVKILLKIPDALNPIYIIPVGYPK
ncbi:MAG: SagB/ThcOx family dehydrogenase [Promethearchaeota archaeon]